MKAESPADSTYIVDTLVETALPVSKSLDDPDPLLTGYGARKNQYGLLTIHRAENTNSEEGLLQLLVHLTKLTTQFYFLFIPEHEKK